MVLVRDYKKKEEKDEYNYRATQEDYHESVLKKYDYKLPKFLQLDQLFTTRYKIDMDVIRANVSSYFSTIS